MNLLKNFQSREENNLNNLVILFLSALFFWMSLTCLIPTLPAYIKESGATAKQVGYVMGCFAIGLLFSRVWLGKLADEGLTKFVQQSRLPSFVINFFTRSSYRIIGKLVHYPSRKVIILIGAIVAFVAPLGYLLFNSLGELMAIRAFHGISIAAFTTGYSALVVDLSPAKRRGELLGYMSLSVPIGMAIGPLVGGLIEAYGSYSVLFFVSASSGLIAFILACKIQEFNENGQNISNIPAQESAQHTTAPSAMKSNPTVREILFDRSFSIPSIILLLIGCLFGTMVTFLPLYVKDIGLNFNVGLFYTTAAIASFAVRFVSGQASDKYGRGVFITISIICYIFSMTLLTFAHNSNMLLLSGFLEGSGAGMLIPITLALISDRCYANARGKVFSICVSGFDVGVALGGPVLGSLLLDLGYRFLFGITVIMAILALIIFTVFCNKDTNNSFRFAIGNAPDLYAIKQ